MQKSPSPTSPPAKNHRLRTALASLFGIIGLALALSSVIVVWANRTLTDTHTYVQAVGPLLGKPAIQNFAAARINEQITKSSKPDELAAILLPANVIAGKTPEQLAAITSPLIESSVVAVMSDRGFDTVWRNINEQQHASIMRQIAAHSDHISINLQPLLQAAVNELGGTKLAPLLDKLALDPASAKFDVKGSSIDRVERYYNLFQEGTVLIVVLAVVSLVLAVWLSVHHLKTLRRVLAAIGLDALATAALLEVPSFVPIKGVDEVTRQAALAIGAALFGPLQLACVALGILCFLVIFITKWWEKRRA